MFYLLIAAASDNRGNQFYSRRQPEPSSYLVENYECSVWLELKVMVDRTDTFDSPGFRMLDTLDNSGTPN